MPSLTTPYSALDIFIGLRYGTSKFLGVKGTNTVCHLLLGTVRSLIVFWIYNQLFLLYFAIRPCWWNFEVLHHSMSFSCPSSQPKLHSSKFHGRDYVAFWRKIFGKLMICNRRRKHKQASKEKQTLDSDKRLGDRQPTTGTKHNNCFYLPEPFARLSTKESASLVPKPVCSNDVREDWETCFDLHNTKTILEIWLLQNAIEKIEKGTLWWSKKIKRICGKPWRVPTLPNLNSNNHVVTAQIFIVIT